MAVKLLIWDWNGTLLDDVSLCNDCLNTLLREYGYSFRYNREEYKEIFDFPIIDYYRRAGFDFNKHPYQDLAARFVEIYTPASLNCPLCPGAKETLDKAQAADIQQIILSASQRNALAEQVACFHLSDYFNELIGQDDFYAHGKLEAGRSWLADHQIDCSQTFLVGDSLHDAEVAAALGVQCVLCAAGHQSRCRLEQAGVSVIDTLHELPSLLNL